ncbi:hypothetical protein ILUMI_10209 [Ignelater luminosus]|uniref:Mutator-like transposase domain-containing protein n=1 Tax=Ignelater luminosus TaxID=2038154 RepID=A0A8K0D2U8_IGNLU|nr:hypothetical protein ILUMI_10209 [Ignelater luminosus]
MFYNIENDIEKDWKESLWRSMEVAVVREQENAILNKQFFSDGTPMISVHADGSWSKRSYDTNYNCLSGLVAIVGKHTKELLLAGVGNRFCSICVRAENWRSHERSLVLQKLVCQLQQWKQIWLEKGLLSVNQCMV